MAAHWRRLWRGGSKPSACGSSVYSCPQPQMMQCFKPGSERSCRGWHYRAGPTAATCGSTPAGPQPKPPKFAGTRRNWWRSRPTSSWPMAPRPWQRCYNHPAPCRSFLRRGAIRLAAVTSRASCAAGRELLKQIAPSVTRAAVLRDATQGSGTSAVRVRCTEKKFGFSCARRRRADRFICASLPMMRRFAPAALTDRNTRLKPSDISGGKSCGHG